MVSSNKAQANGFTAVCGSCYVVHNCHPPLFTAQLIRNPQVPTCTVSLFRVSMQGQPQWGASVRCWASGNASTGHLQQLLSVKYPLHAAGLLGNWQLVEGIKEGFCCAAADYRETLRAVAAWPDTAGKLLLYTPVHVKQPLCVVGQPAYS